MKIASLRTGDRFIFDHELAECCAVGDAVVTDSESVAVVYEHRREVRSRTFDLSVEVDLVSRGEGAPMSLEEWAPIPGCPEYAVSDQGRVFRFETTVLARRRGGKAFPMRVRGGYLKPSLNVGYRRLTLYGTLPRYVHQLVLGAFVGKQPKGHVVEHINGIGSDNRLENLRYALKSDYYARAGAGNRRNHHYGEDHPNHKFSNERIAELRRVAAKRSATYTDLAADFDMSRQHARDVVHWRWRVRG